MLVTVVYGTQICPSSVQCSDALPRMLNLFSKPVVIVSEILMSYNRAREMG